MAEAEHWTEVQEHTYEVGKNLRILPESLQELGVYTIRLLKPPDSSVYAVESLVAIQFLDQLQEDEWLVDYTMPDENSGEIVLNRSRFSNDGHMFLRNIGRSRIPEYDTRVHVGYMLEDTNWQSLNKGLRLQNP